MDSIEMAGASLDFFEDGETEKAEEIEASGEEVTEEVTEPETEDVEMEAQSEEDETIEAAGEESEEGVEAATEEEIPVIEDDAETLSLVEEESHDEFVDQAQAFSIIESLLFSSDRPIGIGTFKQVFKGTNYKTKDIKKALDEMTSVYADASRGVSLEEINGGWQLRTKVDNMDFMRKLSKARPFKLSGPALEVLAIIAYKQPIVKSEVDQIRGVESGHLVRALMEKHLVCFQGKSELPGKPMQYGTTRKFLEIFGLRNLKELPSLDEIDQLLPDGIGMEEEDEKLSDVTANMSEDYQGNYSESEEELEKIADTLGGIDTSSEFFEEEKKRQKEKRDRERAQDIREAMDVGELVEEKDKRWLARYDEKIAEAAATAGADAICVINTLLGMVVNWRMRRP
ncbi:MAG: SMC-Scp complex subunit ScpB, partial [Bdellovibrionales bacterium]|nr:SMC-Scp complex subunit ScpB [Bdellovibrionales bacterium]